MTLRTIAIGALVAAIGLGMISIGRDAALGVVFTLWTIWWIWLLTLFWRRRAPFARPAA